LSLLSKMCSHLLESFRFFWSFAIEKVLLVISKNNFIVFLLSLHNTVLRVVRVTSCFTLMQPCDTVAAVVILTFNVRAVT
jgi:hypothetical protein